MPMESLAGPLALRILFWCVLVPIALVALLAAVL